MRFALTFAALLLLTLHAQSPTGEISGVVRDASGAIVPDAEIIAVNQNTNETKSTRSDSQGLYTLAQLPVGVYHLTVRKSGFRTLEQKDIELSALQSLRTDFHLAVGEIAESVTVTAETPQVDTRSSMYGMLVDDRRVRDLPLNGRNPVDLVRLLPGINSVGSTIRPAFGQQQIQANGGRYWATNFLLDGGSVNYFHRGAGLELPPPDALQEFRVVTVGTPAEYGRGSVTLSAVTRSGTNQFHGSAWEFLRNDDFDARSFFSGSVPKLRFNQFGFTNGGAVKRNKHFFFLSYQGLRIREDQVSSASNPPTDLERRGDFSASRNKPLDPANGNAPFPNAIIPTSRFDPVAAKVLQQNVPEANRPNGQYVGQVSRPTSGNQWIGRWDTHITDRQHVNFRYFTDDSSGAENFPESSSFPGYSPFANTLHMQTATAEHTFIITPTILNALRATSTRFNYEEANTVRRTLVELGATDFLHAGGPATVPVLNISGRFNLSPGRDRQRLSTNMDISENLTWTRGPHQVKFGADVQLDRFTYRDNSTTGGSFSFDGSITKDALADFFLGRSIRMTQASPLDTDQRYTVQGYFAQDTWKISQRITVSAGLRWELYPVFKDRFGKSTSYVAGAKSTRFPNAPTGLVFLGDAAYPYRADYNNLAPRLGIAWDVFGNGRTSIRSSFGVFYEPLTGEMAGGVLLPQPFGLTTTIDNPLLSAPYRGRINPFPYVVDPTSAKFVLPVQIPKSFDPGLRIPYTMNYNFGIQQQVTRSLMLETAYVGNGGRKLPGLREFNPAFYGPGAATGNTQARRALNPNYGSIGMLYTGGNSSYNSLQIRAVQRFHHGLTFSSAYTWAKVIDEYGGGAFANVGQQEPQNVFDLRGDRGRGENDLRHRWVSSYLYELPFLRGKQWYARAFGGWEMGGILTLATGTPITMLSGRDNSLSGVGFDRPNVNGSPELPSGRSRDERMARYFKTEVFTANLPGQYGNSGRAIMSSPGSIGWDVSLSKAIRIKEAHTLQFRWDAFNPMNHANLGSPNTTLTSPAFGRIQSTSGGRVMQVSLKYSF